MSADSRSAHVTDSDLDFAAGKPDEAGDGPWSGVRPGRSPASASAGRETRSPRVRADANLVIGAAGVNSKVREFVLVPRRPRYTSHIAHRAVIPAALLNRLLIQMTGIRPPT